MPKITASQLRTIIAEEARRFVNGESEQMPEFNYTNITRLSNGQRPLYNDGRVPAAKEEKYKEVSQEDLYEKIIL